MLSLLGSQFPDVLAHIQAENDKDPKLRKLFVRNLSFETTSETLQEVFSEFGAIQEAVVIMSKQTSRSKGYGFVTFMHMEDASRAIANPTMDIDGRSVFVGLAARPDNASNSQGSSGGDRGDNGPVVPTKLFIRQLDYKTTSETLEEVFGAFGEIKEAVVLKDRQTGSSKGYGFITFTNAKAANAALAEPQKVIDGRTTFCKLATDGEQRPNNNRQAQYGGGYGGGYGNMRGANNPIPSYGNAPNPSSYQMPSYGQMRQPSYSSPSPYTPSPSTYNPPSQGGHGGYGGYQY